jgi:hypothetical protein
MLGAAAYNYIAQLYKVRRIKRAAFPFYTAVLVQK